MMEDNNETVSEINIIRNTRGEYGATIMVWVHGMTPLDVPCRFFKLEALYSHIADLTAEVLKGRGGHK